jgi:orotidine-5'-phosphate decarboxylase
MTPSPLILALDVDSKRDAMNWTRRLSAQVDIFKVGPRLFLKSPDVITAIHKLGKKVFLDFKFHDIPTSVASAVRQVGLQKIYAMTLHASGGLEMLKQSLKAFPRPRLWGVTVLTSMDQKSLRSIGIMRSPNDQVARLTDLCAQAQLDGIVCSVKETVQVRRKYGKRLTIVNPGISWGTSAQDQKRTARPKDAAQVGANFVVVGRAILSAKDPLKTAQEILEEFYEHSR